MRHCAKVYSKMVTKPLNNSMICTYSQGKDTCQGDSGGPLSCRMGNRWYVSGLTSWGAECASSYPGLYANVAMFSDWIWSTIAAEERKG